MSSNSGDASRDLTCMPANIKLEVGLNPAHSIDLERTVGGWMRSIGACMARLGHPEHLVSSTNAHPNSTFRRHYDCMDTAPHQARIAISWIGRRGRRVES